MQHSWLLLTQLHSLVPFCFTATESDLVNLKGSEQRPDPHALQDTAPEAQPAICKDTTVCSPEREKVTGLATQAPAFQLTSPTSQLPHEKKAMQSATAEHLPGSKPSPYSLPGNALFELSALRAHTPGRCSQEQLHTAPLLLLLTLCSKT